MTTAIFLRIVAEDAWDRLQAGASLGAGPLRSFFLVTLPLLWPTMLAGWLFAFIVSFGELNTAIFLTGPGTTTLPIEIFSYLQFQGSQLVIAAASALQVAMIVVMVAPPTPCSARPATRTASPGASAVTVPDYRPFDDWMAKAKNGGIYYIEPQAAPERLPYSVRAKRLDGVE